MLKNKQRKQQNDVKLWKYALFNLSVTEGQMDKAFIESLVRDKQDRIHDSISRAWVGGSR